MATVALVSPQIATSGWGRGLRPGTMEDVLPRRALTALSSPLRREGHRPFLVDLRLLSGWHEYEATLRRERPDFVCVTAHTVEIEEAVACCERAKRVHPACITVGGGIHLTMFPGDATSAVDFVIRGEGELALPRLLADPASWPRVCWGEPPDLDLLPLEDRSLYPDFAWRMQFPMWSLPPPTAEMLTGRGCPYACRFCCGPGEQNLYSKPAPSGDGRRIPSFRRRSVESVIAEIAGLRSAHGVRSFVFHDDQFLLDPRWVAEFCRRLASTEPNRRGPRWWAACRADVICRHPGLVADMKRAGLKVVSIGFESFSDALLEWLGKGTTSELNFRAAEICRRLGLEIFANVILGVPRSDGIWRPADDIATVEAIERIRPRYVSPSFFTPVPGSALHGWWRATFPQAAAGAGDGGRRNPVPGSIPGVDYAALAALTHRCLEVAASPLRDRMRYLRFRLSPPGPSRLSGGSA